MRLSYWSIPFNKNLAKEIVIRRKYPSSKVYFEPEEQNDDVDFSNTVLPNSDYSDFEQITVGEPLILKNENVEVYSDEGPYTIEKILGEALLKSFDRDKPFYTISSRLTETYSVKVPLIQTEIPSVVEKQKGVKYFFATVKGVEEINGYEEFLEELSFSRPYYFSRIVFLDSIIRKLYFKTLPSEFPKNSDSKEFHFSAYFHSQDYIGAPTILFSFHENNSMQESNLDIMTASGVLRRAYSPIIIPYNDNFILGFLKEKSYDSYDKTKTHAFNSIILNSDMFEEMTFNFHNPFSIPRERRILKLVGYLSSPITTSNYTRNDMGGVQTSIFYNTSINSIPKSDLEKILSDKRIKVLADTISIVNID